MMDIDDYKLLLRIISAVLLLMVVVGGVMVSLTSDYYKSQAVKNGCAALDSEQNFYWKGQSN